MDCSPLLLKQYRSDCRKLIDFLLSSRLVSELRGHSGPTGALSEIELDSLGADYVIDRIKAGGIIDVAEAEASNTKEHGFPIIISSGRGISFFSTSDPELTGTPPTREPPSIPRSPNFEMQMNKQQIGNSMPLSYTNDDPAYQVTPDSSEWDSAFIPIHDLPLPRLNTALSDDDLRETAYELLLASVASGSEIVIDDRKKEKSTKILSRLKNKGEKERSQLKTFDVCKDINDTVRAQMQISKVMDACIRRNVTQLATVARNGLVDIPSISLGLLNGTFASDFHTEKSYKQWKMRQAHLLEEFLCFTVDRKSTNNVSVKSYISKISDSKAWDTLMSPSERIGVLASIRKISETRSSLPGKYGIHGETYYWSTAYHLNLRLYQKLLSGVFDVLNDGQLIEEAEKFMSLIKSTWLPLGITWKLHNILYAWSLIQQYVETKEGSLLDYAVAELREFLSADGVNEKEKQYMKSLKCNIRWDGKEQNISLPRHIVFSISSICDSNMRNYHLHFSQEPSDIGKILTLMSVVGVPTRSDSGEKKLIQLTSSDDHISEIFKSYVHSSAKLAYIQTASKMQEKSEQEKTHPLALLAIELKLIAEREFKFYYPVLKTWCSHCFSIFSRKLHHLLGEELRLFLSGISSLSDEVKVVLSSANMLDSYLHEIYDSIESDASQTLLAKGLAHYGIEEISKPLILDWVISRHNDIFDWTERAFDTETWEPLSRQQRHAASIVEVFRIMEETVDQFFGFNLPMDITHLQAILSTVFHGLDAYLSRILSQIVERKCLFPPVPPLTRYADTVLPTIRRKLLASAPVEDSSSCKVHELTMNRICVLLNTVHFIQEQVGVLEDEIKKCWERIKQFSSRASKEGYEEEAVDALFCTTIGIIRDTAKGASSKLIDFAGARVVFWDLREKFLFQLYRGEVPSSRLENFLPLADLALNQVCGLMDDNLRDALVLSVCHAFMEGFVWVLLDGGPCRAFSDSDIIMMQDDLKTLKDFFVADGEGVPRSLVDKEAKFAAATLNLFSLKTESLIQMLMNASQDTRLDSAFHGQDYSHTVLRVLCHKKDREASKFLKNQYDLPASSDYDDNTAPETSHRSFSLSDLRRQTSFQSLKNKLLEATSDIMHIPR